MISRDLPFQRGTIVSTDAPYRETRDWLKVKHTQGIDLVDMEVSAVLALASFYGLEAAALMLVSDKLSIQGHRIGFAQPKTQVQMERYFLPFIL